MRRRAALAAVACASALSAPLALEALVRFGHRLLPRDVKVVWLRSRVMEGSRHHRPHPELLWAPSPDAALESPDPGYPWRLRHAAVPGEAGAGHRGDASPAVPADLAVLGDSYTYAFEVDQDNTYVARLARATGLRAVNLGVTSYGTSQEADFYRLYGRRFKPKTLVHVIASNDPLDNVFYREVNRSKDPGVSSLCWYLGLPQRSSACEAAAWLMRRTVVGGILIFQAQAYAKRTGAGDPRMDRGTDMICEDVGALARAAKADGTRYAVALIGLWDIPRLRPLKARLDGCFARLGVPALQLDDVAESIRRGRRFTGRFDWHWNDEGHAYVAAELEAFLKRQGWLERRRGAGPPYLAKSSSLGERVKETFARTLLASHRRGAGAYSYEPPPIRVQRTALGFRFVEDRGCASPSDDRLYCEQAAPKPWTREEIDALAAVLRGLDAEGLGRFLARGRRNGFDTIVRQKAVLHFDAESRLARRYYPNTLHSCGHIVVADTLFSRYDARRAMLHLLAHTFDFARTPDGLFFPTASASADFLRLSGFSLTDRGDWLPPGMTQPQRRDFVERFELANRELLRIEGLPDQERARARQALRRSEAGYARRWGQPTFHALLNPQEAFAEWVLAVHTDEPAARELNPALADWIKAQVLR